MKKAKQPRARPRPPAGRRASRARWAPVVLLILAVAAVVWLKPRSEATGADALAVVTPIAPVATHAVPRLVDVGADACVPCKLMAPILEELRQEYAGRLDVVFIDVWKNPGAGRAYGVYSIPTQIFYDAAGRELFRHPGFISKEEILEAWKKLGVDLQAPAGEGQP